MTDEQRERKALFNKHIGQRVKALRLLAGLDQGELAERAGIQRTHLTRIESGKYDVAISTVQFIAEALGMTVDIVDGRLRDLAPLRQLETHGKNAT